MMNKLVAQYKKYRTRNRRFIGFMFLLLCVTGVVALMSGAHRTGCREIVDLLSGKDTEMSRQIVLNIRLPRILAAIVTGVVLSLSGTVMQILLRNPLASPYTLGISNAAAFGASCCIVFGGSVAGAVHTSAWLAPVAPYLVTLSAFAGSLLGLAVILLIVKARRASVETIVLSGVIINSLFGAGIAVMQYLADNVQLASIVFWNFGDLGRGDWDKIGIMLVVLLPALLYFYFKRWDYKVLASGDDYAQSMGVSPQKSRMSGMVVASLCTAVAVSFFGVIAFVGLVVPHIVRKWIGENEEFLLTGSVVFGGMFLLLCDTVARTVVSPIVLPVGILTSFLGVPLFLFLLTRKKGG